MELNSVVLVGRLTRDPETKTVGSDKSVTKLSVAVNRSWKGADGEYVNKATFVDVEAWGKQGETAAKFLKTGSSLGITGRLEMDEWKNDEGKRQTKLKVVADKISFGDKKEDGEASGSEPEEAPKAASASTGKTGKVKW